MTKFYVTRSGRCTRRKHAATIIQQFESMKVSLTPPLPEPFMIAAKRHGGSGPQGSGVRG